MPRSRSAPLDTAQARRGSRGRGRTDRRHRRAGSPIRSLRVPSDYRAAASRWLNGQREAGRTDLAAGGAQGSSSATEAEWCPVERQRIQCTRNGERLAHVPHAPESLGGVRLIPLISPRAANSMGLSWWTGYPPSTVGPRTGHRQSGDEHLTRRRMARAAAAQASGECS